jgi:ABC-type sugar transport system ATPase subunit
MTTDFTTAESPLAVVASGLSKHYPGVTALDDVSLDFAPGLVTAVIGENGAGKSTLMTILAGLQRPDAGSVSVGGTTVTTFTPFALLTEHGVALVPQEIALCRERSVAENVFLGREGGFVPSRRRLVAETRRLLDELETPIDPGRRAGALPVAEQQLVLVARAIARRCRVLILDEPTSSLTPAETGRLFALLRRLRAAGTTIIYVSHRLPELFELSDRVHVLRDGHAVAAYETRAVDARTLVRAMVGRELAERHARDARTRDARTPGAPVLRVQDLDGPGFHSVSLQVRAGEVVGLAGLPDSGRAELLAALFGAVRTSGAIELDGTPVRLRSPRDAIRAGIGYVPGERRAQAIFPAMDAAANLMVLDLDAASRFGVVRRGRLQAIGRQRMATLDVRGGDGAITKLSGGNQQKVILGRWLARRPRVLLLDEPTRGVDVGAKAEIHARLAEAARDGACVVVSSSDLPELLWTCDRIVVLAHGVVAGVLDGSSATEEEIMALATGLQGSAA